MYMLTKEAYFDLVKACTPEPPPEKTVWAREAKLCMLFVECRPLDIIRYNLWNIANVYGGGDTSLVIVHGGDNEALIHEITRDWTNVRVIKAVEKNQTVDEYNELLSTASFWKQFAAHEYVLSHQWDSYMFTRIPESMFGYDIVGSPCAHFSVIIENNVVMNICADHCKCPRCLTQETHPYKAKNVPPNVPRIYVFNGGFQLRKVSSMLALSESKPYSGEPEDVYFALSNLTRPTREEAKAFGVQDFMYDGVPVGCHQIWMKQPEYYVRGLFRTVELGKIVGRFYLRQDLGLQDESTTMDLITISELIETWPAWPRWIESLPGTRKQLFTMFETSDVHPKIVANMKLFDRVIVPYPYLRDILLRHGVTCVSLDWYTSPLIRAAPKVLEKPKADHLVFLYVGTNDVRKNVQSLVRVFGKLGKHELLVKTNTAIQDPPKNVTVITDRLDIEGMAALYNACDYVISFTRGEGVGLPMLEASYFGKPVVTHDGGVFSNIIKDDWIVLPSKEVPVDHTDVPPFLREVFHGTWWDIDETEALRTLTDLKSPRAQDV